MTLGQVRLYSAALLQLEMGKLKTTAIAVRAGMTDEKSWQAWLKSTG